MSNRAQIIQDARDLINWDVIGSDEAFTRRLIRWCNRSVQWVASECTDAMVPDEIRWTLPATYSSGMGEAVDSYISTWLLDPYVLTFTSSATSSFAPDTSGVWNGMMWLEVTRTDGTLWRGQCREFWSETGGGITEHFVTVDRPVEEQWVNLAFRLSANYLWFRDDVQRVDVGQRFGSNGNPLTMDSLGTAILHDEWSNQNSRQWGYPGRLRREQQYQQPSPNIAPTVAVADQGSWGPEPWGTFDYCFTYIWGYHEERRKSPSGSFIPLFESAPSPISTTAVITNAGETVTLGLPDIAWELNYGDAATQRYGRTGWKKRVYRRRYTTTGGLNTSIEHPEVFQFLADVDDIDTSFTDDGSIVPDYTLRLPTIGGYYAWSMWPLPQSDQAGMEYQLRVFRRPGDLLNDYDAPRIVPQCVEAITYKLVSFVANHDKQPELAQVWEERAKAVIARFRSMIANPTGMVGREAWDGAGRGGGWPRARMQP